MTEDRRTVAEVVCLACGTKMRMEIPSDLVDDIGIAATMGRIESSVCFICSCSNYIASR